MTNHRSRHAATAMLLAALVVHVGAASGDTSSETSAAAAGQPSPSGSYPPHLIQRGVAACPRGSHGKRRVNQRNDGKQSIPGVLALRDLSVTFGLRLCRIHGVRRAASPGIVNSWSMATDAPSPPPGAFVIEESRIYDVRIETCLFDAERFRQ